MFLFFKSAYWIYGALCRLYTKRCLRTKIELNISKTNITVGKYSTVTAHVLSAVA